MCQPTEARPIDAPGKARRPRPARREVVEHDDAAVAQPLTRHERGLLALALAATVERQQGERSPGPQVVPVAVADLDVRAVGEHGAGDADERGVVLDAHEPDARTGRAREPGEADARAGARLPDRAGADAAGKHLEQAPVLGPAREPETRTHCRHHRAFDERGQLGGLEVCGRSALGHRPSLARNAPAVVESGEHQPNYDRDVGDLLRGAIRLHVLHHASEGELNGAWMAAELAEHGYAISPGTLYPTLHRMEAAGLLRSRRTTRDGRVIRLYRATAAGRAALAEERSLLAELAHEVLGLDVPSLRGPASRR